MKIRSVTWNNQKKAFEATTFSGRQLSIPYSRLDPKPSRTDLVHDAYPDPEFGKEAFTYVLESGDEGAVHIDHLLEYNEDPAHMARLALHELTVEAQRRVDASPLSKREIMRRLGTSQSQFYRLLDPTNYKKSMTQLIELLAAVDCEVEFVVKPRK